MKTMNIEMDWDSITLPLKKGTPISLAGQVANNSKAIGLVINTVDKKPLFTKLSIMIGGDVDLLESQKAYGESYSSDALAAMDGIRFFQDGTAVPDRSLVVPNATATKAGIVKQAANVAASTAEDVAGCVTSINAILTALKSAGIMVADSEE